MKVAFLSFQFDLWYLLCKIRYDLLQGSGLQVYDQVTSICNANFVPRWSWGLHSQHWPKPSHADRERGGSRGWRGHLSHRVLPHQRPGFITLTISSQFLIISIAAVHGIIHIMILSNYFNLNPVMNVPTHSSNTCLKLEHQDIDNTKEWDKTRDIDNPLTPWTLLYQVDLDLPAPKYHHERPPVGM